MVFTMPPHAERLILPAQDSPASHLSTAHGDLVVPPVRLPERAVEVETVRLAELVHAAREAAVAAYAPFSKFRVGAALVMGDDPEGEIIPGSNVENSSYGGTVCAERTAIFSASARGFRRLRWLAVSTVATLGAELRDRSPCGICRQVIREFADGETLVLCDNGAPGVLAEVFDIERLLPSGFRFAPEA